MQAPMFEIWTVTDDWDDLQEMCDGLLSEDDAVLLRECVGKRTKTIVVEREYIDKDFRNVYSAHYSKKFTRLSSRAIRLHLFETSIETSDFDGSSGDAFEEVLAARVNKESVPSKATTTPGYIGYMVLRPTEYSRIGRCLLDPRKVLDSPTDRRLGCFARFKANIMGHDLRIEAFPHQSQDAEVHTCAETAVWALFRYLSSRYSHYPEKYPYDIASLNTDLHWGRLIPSRGLFMNQVTAMFGAFGLGAEIYEGDEVSDLLWSEGTGWASIQSCGRQDNLLRLCHTHIASGLPPIIGLPRHAVVGLGLEVRDTVANERGGKVIPSTDFLSAIYVNDDNFAPYRRVDRTSPGRCEVEPKYVLTKIDSLVVPLPEKVFLTADKIEIMVTDILNLLGEPDSSIDRYVRRILCTSSKNYKQWRLAHPDAVGSLLLRQPLPHFIWIAELHDLKEWSKGGRQAVAEIALDATAGHLDKHPFLWVRYPKEILVNWGRLYGESDDSPSLEWDDLENSLTFAGFEGNLEAF